MNGLETAWWIIMGCCASVCLAFLLLRIFPPKEPPA